MRSPRFALSVCTALSLVAASNAWADPITFNLSGSTISSSYGNSLTYAQDGLTLKVTAWGYTYGAGDNALENAALGRWSTGLGVCDRSEGTNCGDPAHQVDNVGPDNFVLFAFDHLVDPTTIRVDPYNTWDRDVSYWIGTVADPFSLDLTGLAYSSLTGPTWSGRYDDFSGASSAARDVAIQGGGANVILFGTYVDEPTTTSTKDRFKISAATVERVTVPEPSTLLLTGAGLAIFGFRRSKRLS